MEEDIKSLLYRSVEKEISILTKLQPTVLFQTIRNSTEGEFDFLLQELSRCLHKVLNQRNTSNLSSPTVPKEGVENITTQSDHLISFQQIETVSEKGNNDNSRSIPAGTVFSSLNDFDNLTIANNQQNQGYNSITQATNVLTPTLATATEFTQFTSAHDSCNYRTGDLQYKSSEDYNNANISPTVYANAPSRFQFPSSGVGSSQSLSIADISNKDMEKTENRVQSKIVQIMIAYHFLNDF